MDALKNLSFLILAAVIGWVNGYHFNAWLNPAPPPPPPLTWAQIVQAMPPSIKRDIAIDFCVANKRMCRTMPLSSPINPMDGRTK